MTRLTEEELSGAVSALLSPFPAPTRDAAGQRPVASRFLEMQQRIASAFLSDPKLLYGLASETVARRTQEVAEAQSLLSNLRANLRASLRRVLPIQDLGPLEQAVGAALDLSEQPGPVLSDSEAFTRFQRQTGAHLQRTLPSLLSKGAVAPAPGEAKMLAAEGWISLKQAQVDLVEKLALLEGVRRSYLDSKLPSVSGEQVKRRVYWDMVQLRDHLQEVTPEERTHTLKADSLRILGARAALQSMGSLPEPRRYYSLKGPLVFSSDADHPAALAQTYLLPAPYEINQSGAVQVTTGELPSVSIQISTSGLPTLEGAVRESYSGATQVTTTAGPYTFGSGTKHLELFGRTSTNTLVDLSLVFAEAAGVTAAEAATQVQDYLTLLGLQAEFSATDFGGALRISALLGGLLYLGSGTANTPLGYTPAGGITVTDSASIDVLSANAGNYTVTASVNDTVVLFLRNPQNQALVTVTVTLAAGLNLTSTVAAAIQSAIRAVGLEGSYSSTVSSSRVRLQSLSPGAGYELQIGTGNANALLGFTPGSYFGSDDRTSLPLYKDGFLAATVTISAGTYSARTLAADIAGQLGSNWRVLSSGAYTLQNVSIAYVGAGSSVSRIKATGPGLATALGLTVGVEIFGRPLTAQDLAQRIQRQGVGCTAQAVLPEYVERQVATTAQVQLVAVGKEAGYAASSSPAPMTLRLAISNSTASVSEKVRLGDGSLWTVTAVTATYVEATGTMTPVPSTKVSYVLGPTLALTFGAVIEFTSGVLQGTYTIRRQVDALVVELLEPLPSTPPEVAHRARVGYPTVLLTAREAGTMLLSGTPLSALTGSSSLTLVPLSTWVRAAETPEVLAEQGDLLEIHTSSPFTPSETHTVNKAEGVWIRVDGAGKTLGLSYQTSGVVPFARVRSRSDALLTDLTEDLAGLLASATSKEGWRTEADLRIHKVTSSRTPTTASVQAALQQLDGLVTWLSSVQEALFLYSVPRSPQLERILKGLREMGADRAEDLLLDGDLVSFFSMESDSLTHAAKLSQDLRQVVRTRMPADATQQGRDPRVAFSSDGDDPETEDETSDERTPELPPGGAPRLDSRTFRK